MPRQPAKRWRILSFRIENRTIRRCFLLLCLVVLFGTAGYTWIEGWTPWQSLFFTLVTLTTVGYGDYGLSEYGERFTAVLMIGGIGSVSYCFSQLFQHATACAIQPEKRMIHAAQKKTGHHIVCGLGRTGVRVINRLREAGCEVVAIDSDQKLVDRMRAEGVVAICGDAASDDCLEDAGVERAHSVAAVTSSDATNAMICLTTSALAPDVSIVARAEDTGSVQKLRRAGAEVVVNPTEYGGDGIAESMVRPDIAMLLFGQSSPESTLRFSELVIDDESEYRGMTIAQLGMANPRLVIVGAMTSDHQLEVRPDSSRILGTGDVLVIAGAAHDVDRVNPMSRAA